MNTDKKSVEIWKSQHLDQKPRPSFEGEMEALAGQLDKAEWRNRMLTTAKTIFGGAGILLLSLSWLLVPSEEVSWMTIAGSLVAAAAALSFLVGYWRKRSRLNELDRSLPAEEFLRSAISALSRQQTYFEAWFSRFIGVLVVAANFIFAGLMQEEPLWERLSLHAIVTILIVGEAILGVRFRKKIFIRKDLELLDRLNGALRSLQARDGE